MLKNQILEVIKERRTMRQFNRFQEVDPKAVQRIIEAAIWAPLSIYQLQEWKFFVCQGAARDQAIKIILEDPTVLKYTRIMYEKEAWGPKDTLIEKGIEFGLDLGGAPLVIIAVVKTDPNKHHMRHNLGAVWCAAQNMMLQVQAEKLDSGLVTFISQKMEARLIKFFGLDPDKWQPAYALNIGEGQQDIPPIERKKDGVVFFKNK